ncbi:cell wall metabolism sensor histidine kinase WalK [Bacillus sp. EAC]|uniref:sensor histidine kinase n=1 Tax=Bacillus sp. EAC TaxID=1978338 RepID=UPI00211B4684|nr:cell wall metabolism sensor histidine kinase WalK [Bacillus sp. EAC]
MRRIFYSLSFLQKLWLTICLIVICTTIFFFLMFQYAYKQLYVSYVRSTLIQEGNSLVKHYHEINDDKKFEQFVSNFDNVSNANVIFVSNPRDLSACIPYNLSHQSFITEDDRETLLKGKTITKTGFEEKFKRQIIGVVVPVVKGEKLEGIVYLHLPLRSITELIQQSKWILLISTLIFAFVVLVIGRRIIKQMIKPLSRMEQISYKMANGDYTERIKYNSGDEVGKLASAFNSMSESLQKEDENRKEFLANVSHELRTPLSYVKGYSEAILDGVVKPPQQLKYVGIIRKEAGRMQRLVRDLLDLATLDAKQLPLNKEPNVIAQLIEDTLETYTQSLNRNEIKIVRDIDETIIANVDPDRFQQVIHNLIDNSIRYTPNGKSIFISLSQNKKVILEIIDEGKGVPNEEITSLGERFYRVDKARSRNEGGTGLGLAIVKQIIDQHNGEIRFSNYEGKGLRVIISLPLFEQ